MVLCYIYSIHRLLSYTKQHGLASILQISKLHTHCEQSLFFFNLKKIKFETEFVGSFFFGKGRNVLVNG